MSRVLTNNCSLAYCVETALGVAGTTWYALEPNDITTFGAEIKTVARSPINKNRQRQKGIVVDLDSKVEFQADLTMEHLLTFMQSFLMARFNGPGLTDGAPFMPTAVTSTGYTVASGGALAQYTLIYARGFATAANNGLKVVGSGSTGTEIKTSGLTAETGTAARFASVMIAGVQGTASDITVTSGGNLASTVLDFTTLGLTVGQFIWVGGASSGLQFAVAANTGFARVVTIAANLLTLDQKTTTFATDAGTGKTIQLLFGRYGRNVDIDDADYLEQSLQFELWYPDLGGVGTDKFEYAKGNYCNELNVSLPLTDKAAMTFGFIGTDTQPPTASRASGASSPVTQTMQAGFGTASDIGRLHITEVDETARATYFKTLSLKINNNVSPEKVLGTLGAAFINTGDFEVDVDAQILFTDSAVCDAIRNNTTMSLNFAVNNEDGGAMFALHNLVLTGGKRDFPVNETVLLQTTAMAHQDSVLGTTMGVSVFPYLP